MADRDIWLHQEDSTGKYVRRLLSPTAAKHTLSLNGSGQPVATAAAAAVTDSAAAQSEAIDVTNMTDGSANNVLIDIPGTTYATEAADIERNFDKIADEINVLRTLTNELQTKLNSALAALRTANIIQ